MSKEIMSTKSEIRKQLKIAELEYLSSANIVEESMRIFTQISNTQEFKTAKTILLYMSIQGEVITQDFIDYCIAENKKVVLPKVNGDNLKLKIYGELVPGYKGILEPSENSQDISPAEIDLAIIPGIAFTIKDNKICRLGRGGGFYDRLIPSLYCPVFAVAYPFRKIKDIPLDEWDMFIDKLFI